MEDLSLLYQEMLSEYESMFDHDPTLNPKYKSLWTTEFLTKEQFRKLLSYVGEEESLYDLYHIPFKYFIMTQFTLLLWVDEDISVLQRYTVSEQMAIVTKRFRKDRVNRILQSTQAFLNYVFSLNPDYLVEYCIMVLKNDEANYEYCCSAYRSGTIRYIDLDEDEWTDNLYIVKAYTYK